MASTPSCCACTLHLPTHTRERRAFALLGTIRCTLFKYTHVAATARPVWLRYTCCSSVVFKRPNENTLANRSAAPTCTHCCSPPAPRGSEWTWDGCTCGLKAAVAGVGGVTGGGAYMSGTFVRTDAGKGMGSSRGRGQSFLAYDTHPATVPNQTGRAAGGSRPRTTRRGTLRAPGRRCVAGPGTRLGTAGKPAGPGLAGRRHQTHPEYAGTLREEAREA